MARFGEVLTAMVTPFAPDGGLDVKAARTLAGFLVENGSDGIVVAGTTGESPTLTHDEKLDLFTNVVEEVGDRAKVIAGTGTNNTAESIQLTKEAAERGVDGCLVVTPYYSRPPQNALLAHFRAVADQSPVPLILYDIPGRTGRRIERPTMVELAAHEMIVADKDAVGDASETARLRADLDDAGRTDFEIYSGDDVLLFPHIAAGAVGIVSVCSHVVGPRMRKVFEDWKAGDAESARAGYLELMPLLDVLMSITTSPIPIKAALALLGHEVGEPRLPLVPATEPELAAIRKALGAAGLL